MIILIVVFSIYIIYACKRILDEPANYQVTIQITN